MPEEKIIFIACGQKETEPREIKLGKALEKLVNKKSGFKAFLAETVSSPKGLTSEILENLDKCVGFIGVLHKREDLGRIGVVADVGKHHRSSLWINQEIAIITYRSFHINRDIPWIVFAEEGIIKEGLLYYLAGKAIPFTKGNNVIQKVKEWIGSIEINNGLSDKPVKLVAYRIKKGIYNLAQVYNAGQEDLEDLKVTILYTRSGVGQMNEEVHKFINEFDEPISTTPFDCKIIKKGTSILITDFPTKNVEGKVKINIKGKEIYSGNKIDQKFEI